MRPIDATRLYFDRAADQMDLSENMRELLLTAKREVSVQIAVELDSGEISTMIGYRVQHDDARVDRQGLDGQRTARARGGSVVTYCAIGQNDLQ